MLFIFIYLFIYFLACPIWLPLFSLIFNWIITGCIRCQDSNPQPLSCESSAYLRGHDVLKPSKKITGFTFKCFAFYHFSEFETWQLEIDLEHYFCESPTNQNELNWNGTRKFPIELSFNVFHSFVWSSKQFTFL
jgi:hypothetical protein